MFIENITNEVGANLLNIKNIIDKAIRIELHFDHYIQTKHKPHLLFALKMYLFFT